MAAVLVMLDGVRPDAIAAAGCPALDGLRARGATTLTARSVMPSITLPCHTSIFYSVPPERHGITSNDWQPMARPLPGLVEVAKQSGLRCGFFYNWEQLRDMARPGTMHSAFFRNSSETAEGDDEVADAAAAQIGPERLDFAFVYFGTVDSAGHAFGWMSPPYLAQLRRVDAALGRLLAALPAETTVLVQADHGGHDRSHGTDSPEDMTIPWLLAGPTIRKGYEIAEPVSLLDTAPTLARVLGLAAPAAWEGRAVAEAFT